MIETMSALGVHRGLVECSALPIARVANPLGKTLDIEELKAKGGGRYVEADCSVSKGTHMRLFLAILREGCVCETWNMEHCCLLLVVVVVVAVCV